MPVWNKHDYFKIILNWISGILHVSVNVAPVSSSQICVYLNSGRILLWTALRRWLNLGRRAEKPQPFLWKLSSEWRERRRVKQNREPLVYTLDFFALIALQSTRDQRGNSGARAERRRRRRWGILFFTGIESLQHKQRGLDFALVQARHSSKVISYFATKALSTSLFFSKRLCLEKQSATAGV